VDSANEDDDVYVIFSLSVQSEHPIAAFVGIPGRKRPPRPDDNYFYSFGKTTFVDNDWQSRADSLDAALQSSLDRLDATGVDIAELDHPDVFVKALFTFGLGPETISAQAIARLARIRATVWIDNNNG
jgi:hypothetical protein